MSKQLVVTLLVDPACAARVGHSMVGEHTLTLSDLDLESLTEDQRDTLAHHLARTRADHWSSDDTNWGSPLARDADPISEATVPVLAGLLDVRRKLILVTQPAAAIERKTKQAANADTKIQKVIEEIQKVVEIEERYTPAELGLDEESITQVAVTRRGRTGYRYNIHREHVSKAVLARLAAVRAEVEAEALAGRIACEPVARERMLAQIAEMAEQAAAYTALYARLPNGVRERDAAGYASEEEISDLVIALAISDVWPEYAAVGASIRVGGRYYAGPKELKKLSTLWPHTETWSESKALSTLSDTEYGQLRELEKEAPNGAKVQACEVWDESYRAATDEDRYDDEIQIDDDDEVLVIADRARVVIVTWKMWRPNGEPLFVSASFSLAESQEKEATK